MIVTIDGPAGTGKSTAAKRLAERLGFAYLDTGAMYRAAALACLQAGIGLGNEQAAGPTAEAGSFGHERECAEIVRRLNVRVADGRTWLDGEDVTEAIRTAEVTAAASVVAQIPEVRSQLVDLQRRVAAAGNFVCEGRDQGTVAFPQAECKFFITADARTRAERRRQELEQRGMTVAIDELLSQQEERDRRDQERAVAPLRPADDAIVLDTTHLSLDEVVARMEQRVRATARF
jgi:cytidylate kinase